MIALENSSPPCSPADALSPALGLIEVNLPKSIPVLLSSSPIDTSIHRERREVLSSHRRVLKGRLLLWQSMSKRCGQIADGEEKVIAKEVLAVRGDLLLTKNVIQRQRGFDFLLLLLFDEVARL